MKKKATKATTVRFFYRYLRGRSSGISRELVLWRSVLLQLIIDAVAYTGYAVGDKHVAWSLITENRPDFRELCELADINPEFVRDATKGVLYG